MSDARVEKSPDYLAPFNPTPDVVITEVINELGLQGTDVVYDVGCGDGRFVIAAGVAGAGRCVGVEYDAALIERARGRLDDAAHTQPEVRARVSFLHTRAQDVQCAKEATVVFVYLLPKGLAAVEEDLRGVLASGGRVVSHTFAIAGLRPVRVFTYKGIVRTYVYDRSSLVPESGS